MHEALFSYSSEDTRQVCYLLYLSIVVSQCLQYGCKYSGPTSKHCLYGPRLVLGQSWKRLRYSGECCVAGQDVQGCCYE
ncbi:hypothetical protein KDH_59890 [Dictyobacter sp. S3.2.2.5]|uniref:Secreted protein n=1 Tax=Dictyobacter halimunensis TaxID=3026934 RepID=A0ABQ6FZG1_9CHLR|nr:hypothetical protein KDH_59890 [Dictyobacter sp. S3.2.2.5]